MSKDLEAPSSEKVAWLAKGNGRLYEQEQDVGSKTYAYIKMRAEGVTVYAQTAYYALREASKALLLAPEHIEVRRCEQ